MLITVLLVFLPVVVGLGVLSAGHFVLRPGSVWGNVLGEASGAVYSTASEEARDADDLSRMKRMKKPTGGGCFLMGVGIVLLTLLLGCLACNGLVSIH